MNRPFLLLTFLVLCLTVGCDDDDGLSPITNIGRVDGWRVHLIFSDFATQAEDAIANVSDAALAAADTTRSEISAAYAARVAQVTDVDDCDRDDVVIFSTDGATGVVQGGVTCPGTGDPTVLFPFRGLNFATDADATELRLRNAQGQTVSTYEIRTLTGDRFILGQRRTVVDTLLGDFTYDIEYQLIAD